MLVRLLVLALAILVQLIGSSISNASHPFQGSGQVGNVNYLYRNLEAVYGNGTIFYTLCGSPYGVPAQWRIGVENWDWLDCGGEIVTGPDAGGGAHLRSWKGPRNVEIYGFYVFSSFGGGVRVGSGQLYGDAIQEIIAGQGPGGNQVKVTDVNGNTIRTFTAYTPTLGVFVAGGQVNGSGEWEIATGADAGGGPHVRIWTCCSGTPLELRGWMAW